LVNRYAIHQDGLVFDKGGEALVICVDRPALALRCMALARPHNLRPSDGYNNIDKVAAEVIATSVAFTSIGN
jgi:hypothetical protein